jgi:hypothetical protein
VITTPRLARAGRAARLLVGTLMVIVA